LGGEEATQGVCRLLGGLLREEVAGVERLPFHVVAPVAPQPDRPTRLRVPGLEPSLGAPEHQDRAGDAAPHLAIRPIVLAIEGSRGPVFLADGVNVSGIPQRLDVGLLPLAWEYRGGGAPIAPRVVGDGVGRRG